MGLSNSQSDVEIVSQLFFAEGDGEASVAGNGTIASKFGYKLYRNVEMKDVITELTKRIKKQTIKRQLNPHLSGRAKDWAEKHTKGLALIQDFADS